MSIQQIRLKFQYFGLPMASRVCPVSMVLKLGSQFVSTDDAMTELSRSEHERFELFEVMTCESVIASDVAKVETSAATI